MAHIYAWGLDGDNNNALVPTQYTYKKKLIFQNILQVFNWIVQSLETMKYLMETTSNISFKPMVFMEIEIVSSFSLLACITPKDWREGICLGRLWKTLLFISLTADNAVLLQ